ncbi:glycosyltransferase family 9 protein [Helicobacter anatolicus]|uniref:glycosyltransferase family 9 protein n=1 Tax=Helicobacter anatolicus TaxID=2905874 RepID=UPI001E5A805C|nr:glycosyltransferase family 9 protein [Helicobacter anatolicus]MCE3038033.1 hypothetical protein [Helicobacter anatolicus]
MHIYLGKNTDKKLLLDFLFSLRYLQKELLFSSKNQNILDVIAKKNLAIKTLSQKENAFLHCDLIFMPDETEKSLAKNQEILYYIPQKPQITKSFLKIIRFFFYEIFDFLSRILLQIFQKKGEKKGLVIIKTDAIGDYILFRNFLKPLNEKYGKITLIGNIAYQELFNTFDKDYVDTFIPINRKQFLKNPFYRLKILFLLKKNHFTTLLNPLFSRDLISEQIAHFITAENKITSTGNTSNLSLKFKKYFDKFYTQILPSSPQVTFEFHRNQEFFSTFLNDKNIPFLLELKNPDIVLQKFQLPKPYAVLFIGASNPYRKWSANSFIKVGNFLAQQGLNIVICGGKEDRDTGEYIQKNISHQTSINLCGATSLSEVAKIVYNGNQLLSNETSCVHIAKAIRHDKIFVVYNGNHFHRFTPYPKDLGGEYYGIYHPIVRKNPSAYAIFSNFLQESRLDINAIKAQDVISILKNHLKG